METAYHFRCLESHVVLHRHDARDGGVQSVEREPRREGLIGIALYLDRNLYVARKSTTIFCTGVFLSINEEICLINSTFSSRLGM